MSRYRGEVGWFLFFFLFHRLHIIQTVALELGGRGLFSGYIEGWRSVTGGLYKHILNGWSIIIAAF